MRVSIRKKQRKKKKMKIVTLVLCLSIIFTTIFYLYSSSLFRHITSFTDSIGLSFAADSIEGASYIIIGDKEFSGNIIMDQNEIYLEVDFVKDHVSPRIRIDKDNSRAYIETTKEFYAYEVETLDEFMKDKPTTLNFLLRKVEDIYYLPFQSVAHLIGFDIKYFPDKNLTVIDSINDTYRVGQTLKSVGLLDKATPSGKTIVKVEEGLSLRIYDEINGYYRARTEEGLLGYILKTAIVLEGNPLPIFANSKIFVPVQEKWSPTDKIGLAWDYVNQVTGDRREEGRIDTLDIVSPTWFKLSDNDGSVQNNGVLNYVKDAHSKGYKVWGLVSNSFDPSLTKEFLTNMEAQDNFIRQILLYSSLYDLDGINIDFENIYYEDQEAFTEFVGRLTEQLHQLNLTVSIDVTVPAPTSLNWSMVYDREKLGEIVDYVAVMTYDEHWGSSPKSGSVASINWVEKGIQNTLKSIPSEKILLGLPFYTRLWEEERQSDGTVKVSSRAYGMEAIASILEENNAVIQWNDSTGQYYSQYEKEEKTYKVWLEGERSLALKTSLIHKYNLAGFAAWRKDFETKEVWPVLEEVVKNNRSYEDLAF